MSKKHEEEKNEVEQPTPTPQELETEKIKEVREEMLRLRADFENTKKRLERDKIDAIRYANERVLTEILNAVDNFDRAMGYFDGGHDPKKVKDGLTIAQNELHKVLEQHGVEVIKTAGEHFDPQWHEAVAAVEPTDKIKEGSIVDEVQKGYTLNGRLIRPSRVRVAQKI